MRKFLLTIVSLAVCAGGFAQLRPNEKLVYSATYNMGGTRTHFAQLSLQTDQVKTANNNYFHMSGQAMTYSKWDSYFKIRDFYESYANINGGFKPILYKRSTREGNYTKREKYTFRGEKVVCVSKRKTAATKKQVVNAGDALDVVSTLYKLRTIDFSRQRSASFRIIFDNKIMNASAVVVGKENVSAGNLGNVTCYKLNISASTSKIHRGKNFIWITADTRHIPVRIQFSIPVGSGRISLTSAN